MTQKLAWLTALFTATFVVSPAFTTFTGFEANQLPIPQIDPPIQPAGYAFSIWGVIYAWLVVSAVYGVIKRRTDAGWNAARGPLIISLAIGTPWLFIATQNAIFATVVIIAMAITAIWSLLRTPLLYDRWLLQAPVALYAGWLTAASCVSLGSTLAGYGILFDSLGWAYAGILIALAAALYVYARRPNAPEYLVSVVWALGGIIVANLSSEIGVVALAAAGIIVLISATFALPRRLAI